jgi:hypothetical protein
VGHPFADRPLQRLDALALGGKRRLLTHLLLDAERVGGIELTVKVSMN